MFLVATPPSEDTLNDVIDEARAYNDVVLTSVEDGHRKTLYIHCILYSNTPVMVLITFMHHISTTSGGTQDLN